MTFSNTALNFCALRKKIERGERNKEIRRESTLIERNRRREKERTTEAEGERE